MVMMDKVFSSDKSCKNWMKNCDGGDDYNVLVSVRGRGETLREG